jgi:hypothetical protein
LRAADEAHHAELPDFMAAAIRVLAERELAGTEKP